MTRLLVHVEGQTEESFVNEVLGPHLYQIGYTLVNARLMGNARQRHRRGGVRGWQSAKRDIIGHLRDDPNAIATTMVDFYGMPRSGDRAWPGRAEAALALFSDRASKVEEGMLHDIVVEMGQGFNPMRFVPFVVMHEFEAILFSDCREFANALSKPDLEGDFETVRNQFRSPEEINDRIDYSPSARILKLLPNYQKVNDRVSAARRIGLDSIVRECPHFAEWLERLALLIPARSN